MSRYAWVIDQDHLADPGSEPGHIATNAKGITGPRDATGLLLEALKIGNGTPFKLYDGDGELYYDGRIVWDGETVDHDLPEESFAPLDDFGAPNAGCAEIRYRDQSGAWVSL